MSDFNPRDGQSLDDFSREMEARYRALPPNDRHVFRTEVAVATGLNLLYLKALSLYGRVDWRAAVERIGISLETARRYMALARFAGRAPRLFARLKMLDRRELYRLARLGPARAAQIYPEAADA